MREAKMMVAVAQLRSFQDVSENMSVALELAREASRRGATLVAFPENTPYLGTAEERLGLVEGVDGEIVRSFQDTALRLGVDILLGSFAERGPERGRSYNTSVWIDRRGELSGVYRKVHLFDVNVEGGPNFKESASVAPGETIEMVDWEGVKVGMSVCYDLRFPEMYREMAKRGAEVLTVPAAFTAETGKDHWEVLLRARAIENQCFVLAPNQWGHHIKGRHSYGRSMIIDPWGTVLATAPDGVGLACAELDFNHLREVRRSMPCMQHARLLC